MSMNDAKLVTEIPFPFKGHRLQICETVVDGYRMWRLTVLNRRGVHISSSLCSPHHAMGRFAELLKENKGER